jgi:hypothetical protein
MWTFHIVVLDMTSHHVMLSYLSKLVDITSDHSYLIQYNYISNCKHNFFSPKILLVLFMFFFYVLFLYG